MANGKATLTVGNKVLTATKTNVKVPVTVFNPEGKTQPRKGIDQTVVKEYADAMRGNDDIPAAIFPPVDAIEDEHGNIFLVDGYHRLRASVHVGFTEIAANIYPGTERDAILASVGANATHGLPRTNKDKEKAVLRLLEDEEWRKFSDRQIAILTHTSNTFVGKVRHDNGYGTDERVTARGDVMKTGNIGEGSTGRTSSDVDAEAAAILNGDGETVTAKPEIVDPFSRVIPPRLGYIFDEKRTVEVIISQLRQVRKHIGEQFDRMEMSMNAPSFAGITRTRKAVLEDLQRATKTLRFDAMPYAVCPYCKAEDDNCPACEGRGYLPEDEAKRAPENLRIYDETAAQLNYWNEETTKALRKEAEPTVADLSKEVRRLNKELDKAAQTIARFEKREAEAKKAAEERRTAKKNRGAGVDAATAALEKKAAKAEGATEGATEAVAEPATAEATQTTEATTTAPETNGKPKAPKGKKAVEESRFGEVISGSTQPTETTPTEATASPDIEI
jgi:hypothetical protein